MVAESLRGIICQQLIPSVNNDLVVALEIMINNIAISNNIRENKTHQLKQIIETGSKIGMCTIDQSTFALFEKKLISEETALSLITEKNYINRIKNKQLVQQSAQATGDAASAPTPETKKKGFFR
jgi:twitching motility protein PilT